ncbi:MAG: protein kinase [Myxococcales bacterium]|nr:protein kinase [Myxococcales bacterium]
MTDPACNETGEQPGDLVGGDFRLIAPLGAGGRHALWRGRQESLSRDVVLKRHTTDPARTRREGARLAAIQHPGVVQVIAVPTDDRGRPWLVMAWVDGEDLAAHLARGPIARTRALRWLREVADALGHIHGQGLRHLDVKPANIMVDGSGHARLVDFDIAAGAGEAVLGGTRAYRAPEQLPGTAAGAPADVWALGLLIHRVVTHGLPVGGRVDERRLAHPILVDLVQRCLRADPEDRPSAHEAARCLGAVLDAGTSPFGALAALGAEHADLLLGREDELAACLERVAAHPIVVVSGRSGTGKSSFLAAGVVPRLRAQGTLVVCLEPGPAPFSSLLKAARSVEAGAHDDDGEVTWEPPEAAEAERGLQVMGGAVPAAEVGGLVAAAAADWHRRTSRPVVFAIDQLEAIFNDDPPTQLAWLAAIEGLAGTGVHVVVALRQDFEERLPTPALRQAVGGGGRVVLWEPDPPRLQAILDGLAAAAGLSLAPALVAAIIEGVSAEPPALPLMQMVCFSLQGRGQHLGLADLAQIGGVQGAIERHADAVVQDLARDAVDAALLALVGLSDRPTRSTVDRAALVDVASAGLVAALETGRLIVAPPDAPDARRLVHECLIERWPRMQRVIRAWHARESTNQALEQAAAEWQAAVGREARQTVRPASKAQREAWRALDRAQRARLTPAAQGYLAMLDRSARNRRLIAWAVAFVATAVVIGITSLWRTARDSELATRLKSATMAAQLDRPQEARENLARFLVAEDGPSARALVHRLNHAQHRLHIAVPGWTYEARFSPDGRWLAVASVVETPILVDLLTGARRDLDGHDSQVKSVAFSIDGGLLATGDDRGQLVVRRLDGGCIGGLSLGKEALISLDFRDDGGLVALADGGAISQLAVAGCQLTVRATDARPGAFEARIAGDALVVATRLDGVWRRAEADWERLTPPLKLERVNHYLEVDRRSGAWAVGDGAEIMVGDPSPAPAQPRPLIRRVFATGAGFGVLASESGGVAWHATFPNPRPTWIRPLGRPLALHVERGLLVGADQERGLDIWSIAQEAELPKALRAPDWLTLCADPRAGGVIAAGTGAALTTWSAADGRARRLEVLSGRGQGLGQLACHPTRPVVVTTEAHITRLDGFYPGWTRMSHHARGRYRGLAWSADGTRLAAASEATHQLWLLDAEGQALRPMSGPELQEVRRLAFSPDGQRLAAVERTGKALHVYTVATGAPLPLPDALRASGTMDVAFSAGGLLGRSLQTGHVEIWDVATSPASRRARWAVPGTAWALAFSPDGTHLAAVGGDRLRVWRLADEALVLDQYAHDEAQLVAWTSPDRLATAGGGGDVKIWDRATGDRVGRLARVDIRAGRVAFTPAGPGNRTTAIAGPTGTCVDAGDGTVHAGGRAHAVGAVRSLRLTDEGCIISTGKQILHLRGDRLDVLVDDARVSAWASVHGHVVEARADGTLRGNPPIAPLEDPLPGPATFLAEGPGRTVLVGVASGWVGAYDVDTGVRAFSRALAGPPAGSVLIGDQLTLWSDLGDAVVVDTAAFTVPAERLRLWGPTPDVPWRRADD